jgi:DNA repair protein RadC
MRFLIPLTAKPFQSWVAGLTSKQTIMDYQININHQFSAGSEREAREAARQYVSTHLVLIPLHQGVCLPAEVAEECRSFRGKKKEHFCVIFLDTQNRIIGRHLVSVGTLNASLIHPRETFRRAILKNCCSVIVVHNHPSGSLEPSPEDVDVTTRLVKAGQLLGIAVLDHVIVTRSAYFSFSEARLI